MPFGSFFGVPLPEKDPEPQTPSGLGWGGIPIDFFGGGGGGLQAPTPGAPTYGVTGPDTYIPQGMQPYTPRLLGYSHGKHDAAENKARLARAQYEDYLRRFAPIEEELIGKVGDAGLFQSNAEAAAGAVDNAFDVNEGSFLRGLGRYGRGMDAQESQVIGRQRGLSRTAAMVQAANRARTNTMNRQMRLLGGGLAPQQPQQGGQ